MTADYFPIKPFRAISCLILTLTLLLSGAGVVYAADPDGRMVIDPNEAQYPVLTIAIPTCEALAPGMPTADSEVLVETIYRNLTLLSDFTPPKSRRMVDQQRTRDRMTGKEDLAAWRNLEVDFILLVKTAVEGGSLRAEVEYKDTEKGNTIFKLGYSKYSAQAPQMLGRKIANDIISRTYGEQGLALTRICLVRNMAGDPRRPGWQKDVFVMYADGGDAQRLTNENSSVAAPVWGANGTEIYYTSWRMNNPDLYGVQINGGRPWVISREPQLNVSPSWSEGNKLITLTLAKDGNSEIYVTSRDGRTSKRLTRTRAMDSSPSWSPDGNLICFTSNRDGNRPQLFIMDKNGFNVRRLTNLGSEYPYNDGGVWSPDGTQIAFSCRRGNGKFDIAIINTDGSGFRFLTDSRNHPRGEGCQDPSWAPSGTHIVFSSKQTGRQQLYIVRSSGQRPPQLLTREGINSAPAWGGF